jgi:predicted kinase
MDLERLGRPDLAELFLDAYREDSGDTWPASFAHHHIAYRAEVRAKVAAIRAAQGVDEARARARSLLELALTHLERGRVRLVLVGGLPGTGKSRLAAGLGERLGATVLRSDLVRKQLAGIPPDTSAAAPVGAGIYDPASTIATYQALLDRARSALGLGESVVLDASWQDPTWRAAAVGLADDSAADLTEMRCVAPVEVARARLITRGEKGGNLSDATPEVLAAMAAHEVRWPSAVDVDTTGSAASTLDAALAQLLGAPVKRAVA